MGWGEAGCDEAVVLICSPAPSSCLAALSPPPLVRCPFHPSLLSLPVSLSPSLRHFPDPYELPSLANKC